MTDDDLGRFAAALTACAETFAEPVSGNRMRGYFVALDDLAIQDVERGLAQAMRSCRFFPKPVEVRDLVLGSEDERAAVAWMRLMRALEEVGTYSSVDFGDVALHQCIVQMGGWSELWPLERLDPKELGFRRAEFLRMYGVFDRRRHDEAPRALLGQCAVSNRETRGTWTHALDHVDEVVVIGEMGRAALPRGQHQLQGATERADLAPGSVEP